MTAPRPLNRYNVVIFDCDGVLLDSNTLKIEMFVRVLERAGFDNQVIAAFSDFQRNNFGTSRHALFERLMMGTFGPVVRGVDLEDLLSVYGKACSAGYLNVDETEGARALLQALSGGPLLYVASGSEETELREVFARRGLAEHFRMICGSPRVKSESIAMILQDAHARLGQGPRAVYIGDSHSDFLAAQENGIDFVYLAKYSTVRTKMLAIARGGGFAVFETLSEVMSAP